MFLSLLLTIFIISNFKKDNLNNKLNNEIRIINNSLSNLFTNVWRISEDKGRQISTTPNLNKEKINGFFKRQFSYISSSPESLSSFLWPRFYWLDQNNYILVSSNKGIIKEPVKIEPRSHHFLATQNPWYFYFSNTFLEKNTSQKILNAIIAINNNKEYIGSIIVRFEIDKIIQQINSDLGQNNVNYLILDKDLNDIKSTTSLKLNLDNIENNKIINLENEIINGDIAYNKLLKLSTHPFYILSGYNKKQYYRDLFTIIAKYMLIIITIILLFFIITLSAYKFFIKDMHRLKQILGRSRIASNKLRFEKKKFLISKEKSDIFFDNIIKSRKDPIKEIKLNIEKLTKSETDNLIITKNTRLDIYYNILEHLEAIESFTTENLLFQEIDIIDLTKEAIKHHDHTIIKRNIKIDLQSEKNIKKISLDKLRFLQIISNLIYIAISDRPRSKIIIKIGNTKIQDTKYLKISIIDDGNGLSEKEKESIISKENSQKILYNMRLQEIKKLISLHNGKFTNKTESNIGTENEILIPHKITKQKEQDLDKKTIIPDNVFFLHK